MVWNSNNNRFGDEVAAVPEEASAEKVFADPVVLSLHASSSDYASSSAHAQASVLPTTSSTTASSTANADDLDHPSKWPDLWPLIQEVIQVAQVTGLDEIKAATALLATTFSVTEAVEMIKANPEGNLKLEKNVFNRMTRHTSPYQYNVPQWWGPNKNDTITDMLAFSLYKTIKSKIEHYTCTTKKEIFTIFPLIFHVHTDKQTEQKDKTISEIVALHLEAYKDNAKDDEAVQKWTIKNVTAKYDRYLGQCAPKHPPSGACTQATVNLQVCAGDK